MASILTVTKIPRIQFPHELDRYNANNLPNRANFVVIKIDTHNCIHNKVNNLPVSTVF